MKSENQTVSANQLYTTSFIIWAALLMSQFIFLVVIFVTKPEVFKFDLSKPFIDENATLTLILLFVALTNVALSFVLKSKFINKAIETQKPGLVQTGIIIGCALAESASLLGFVLAFVNSYQYFFIFFIIGIIGILLHFPQRKNFNDASFKNVLKN